MISHDQYPKFRLSTLSITGLLSLLLLISPLSLFSQDNSPPSPDFDGNGTVDIPDFLIFVDLFGSKEGEEKYDAKYDLDGDGEIGIPDFLIFIDSFGKEVNRVPVFTSEPPVMRSVDESTPSGQPIGDPISATDGDGDILTYRLSGADADNFAIDASTGQITAQGTYDFEQKSSYSVTVIVSDGKGGNASLEVNITINNIEEPSAIVPSNVVVEEGDSKLTVRWDAVPDEAGKPPVTGYEVGYRERPDPFDAPGEDSDEWAGIQKVSSQLNSLIITGLLNGQAYQVSVRTLVDGGMSEWSALVSGIPVIPAAGPVFPGSGGGGGTPPPPPPPSPPPPPPPQQPVNPPVVINDNDPPQVTISAGTSPVTEGTAATFTITADPAPATALTVSVKVTEDGDVISGTAPSTVTIDANKTSATLTVATDNDDADESNGVITAEVETGTGYTVGSTSSASVTVNDNDSPPVDNSPDLVIYAMVVSHGLDVILDEPFSFRLDAGVQNKGNGPSAATTLRYYRSTDATFSNDDTQVGTDAVDGLAASGTSTEVIDLTTQPSAGTYYIACVDAVSGESNMDNNCTSIQVGTAPPPPPPPPPTPQVTISAGTSPVTEGTAATFTITASSAPTSALTVNVDVSEDGDVISGTAPSTVTIDANKTSATLTVATDNDNADESNSLITAEVETGTGYTVGSSSSASVTVNDNDNPAPPPPPTPQVTISAGTTPVTEGTSATFTITASPAPTSALTVNVTVTQTGDVISGAPSSSVTIGTTGQITLTVNTVNDEADESNSVVTAEVQSGTGYTVGSTSSASVTVEDNDDSPPVDNSPDLTFIALVVTRSPFLEDLSVPFAFKLTTTVENEGNGPSAATTLRYYRSTDATYSTDDTQVGTDDVDGLAASGTSREEINLTTQPSDGTYYIACVDAVSGESNTENNCSSIQVGTAPPPPPPPPTPQVTISAGTTPVTEGTSATFTITTSSAPTSALTVNVDVSEDGDVISGTASSTVTINANATSATLTVATDNDDADESNSVVTAEVQTGTGYTVGSTSSASVTVNDNDNPSPPPPPPPPQNNLIPSAPTSFRHECITDNCTSIRFNWSPPTQGLPLLRYEFYMEGLWLNAGEEGDNGKWPVLTDQQGDVEFLAFRVSTTSGTFTFKVRAVNEHGTGPEASLTMTITPEDQ